MRDQTSQSVDLQARACRVEFLESRACLSGWYVSTAGSDAAIGSVGAPLRTIAAAAAAAQPGDTVFIHAGTYHEIVRPARSGVAGKPITFTSDGSGQVIVSGGGDPVAETAHGDSFKLTAVHNADVSGQPASSGDLWTAYSPRFIAADGGMILHGGWGQQWVYTASVISAAGPGWATFTESPHTRYEIPSAGNRVYLSGPAPSAVPAAFDLSGRSYVNVVGISIYAATITTDAASRYDQLERIDARWVSTLTGQSNPWATDQSGGIVLAGYGVTLTNSTIADSGGNGVLIRGNACVVSHCSIHDCDLSGGDAAGIVSSGADDRLDENLIYNCARDGIKISHSLRISITHNMIHDVMLQTTDGGGIYTYGTNGAGSTISGNFIYNIHSGGFGAVGIYLDNASQGYTLRANTISNCTIAIKANPPSGHNVIETNTIAGCGTAFAGEGLGGNTISANVIRSEPAAVGSGTGDTPGPVPVIGPIISGLTFDQWRKLPGHRNIGHGHTDRYWFTQPGRFAELAL